MKVPRARVVWGAVVVLALVALLVVLAGCGGGDTTTTTAATETTGSSETAATTATTEAKVYTIGVTQIVQHPALDAGVTGFKEAMTEAGFVEGENVTYDMQNAQGDMAIATSIGQKFASSGVDLILAVATPTAQSVAKATSAIPIVFALVTDPVAAGLVADVNAPEGNVTGVSDHMPAQLHLDLIKQLAPDAKRLGYIYNAGESNSVASMEEERPLAEVMGYEIIEATATNSSEVQQAAASLVGRVDVIALIQDNTVVSALEAVLKVANENKIPVITADIDSIRRGAAAGLGADGLSLGRLAGAMAAKILQGTPIKDVPVRYADEPQLFINLQGAAAQGLTIPEVVLARATEVIK